jgi:sulfate adenylyltransferase
MELGTLIAPHGGVLVDRCVPDAQRAEITARAMRAPVVHLGEVSASDLEMIATGALSPLTGFMVQATYQSVLDNMALPNGLPWTLPITLPVTPEEAEALDVPQDVALVGPDGALMGLLELSEKYTYAPAIEAMRVYATDDPKHPGVARVLSQGRVYLAGDIWLLRSIPAEFPDIHRTPAQTRAFFQSVGWRQVVAFQTRNPIHRAHEYLQKVALEMVDGLMVHPLVGSTKSDDIPADVRVESYRVVLEKYFPHDRVLLSSFPAAMRYAGPREAIFHAICRKNYGCSHFIVGRDHAGVGNYYGTYDAQRIFDQFDPIAIGITPLRFEHAFYSKRLQTIATTKTSPYGLDDRLHLSGTQIRDLLAEGKPLPVEFTRPEVSEVLLRGVARAKPQ